MLEVGTKAPQFTLPDQDGNNVSLSGFLPTRKRFWHIWVKSENEGEYMTWKQKGISEGSSEMPFLRRAYGEERICC